MTAKRGMADRVMKFTYYAVLAPGLQRAAERLVKSRLPDAAVKKSLEGALVFESACPGDKLGLFCFNNIFLVLDSLEGGSGGVSLESHIRKVCRGNVPFPVFPRRESGERTFRVVYSRANQLVRVDEKLKRNAEALISRRTGFRPDRGSPGREYWFLSRTEGFSLFMERITRHRAYDKMLRPGELPPPLAYLMCWLAEPEADHLVIDPFCGCGSIPAQGLRSFPLKRFLAFDLNGEAVKITREKIAGVPAGRGAAEQADFQSLPALLGEGAVDRIVTDPPWGSFGRLELPLEEFYRRMAGVFYRLLKTGGLMVLLTAAREEFTGAVSGLPGLEILDAAPVLVSGKKAGLFRVRKNS